MGFDVRRQHELFKHVVDLQVDTSKASFMRHCHLDYEINFIMEGDITFSLEQDTYHIVPPTLLLIQPGQHHCILTNTVGVPYDRYVFRFNETELSKDINASLETITAVSEVKDQNLIDLFLRLDPYISCIKPEFYTEFLKSALTEIIIYLCSSNPNPSTKVMTNKEIETIITYIHSNLESILSIDDICQNVFMSRAKVNRLFQEQLHTPPMAYVRGKKCILAKKLLLSGYPLTELYEKCGFRQYSTFYRSYRWFFGHAPSEELVSSTT